ncbi:hypothetical protein [Nonomuraea sp. NPDC049784]|uniref:DUF6197 family protein n=1 Tax=Nonomuraea sp. NPDC049784 TaxID=3154361 RepID=UPI0033FF7CA6
MEWLSPQSAASELEPSRLCREAIGILRRLGWTQMHYVSGDGPPHQGKVCLVEAISRATGLPPKAMMPGARARVQHADPAAAAKYRAVDNTLEVLAEKLGRDGQQDNLSAQKWLMNWNDAGGRIREEVLAALLSCEE